MIWPSRPGPQRTGPDLSNLCPPVWRKALGYRVHRNEELILEAAFEDRTLEGWRSPCLHCPGSFLVNSVTAHLVVYRGYAHLTHVQSQCPGCGHQWICSFDDDILKRYFQPPLWVEVRAIWEATLFVDVHRNELPARASETQRYLHDVSCRKFPPRECA